MKSAAYLAIPGMVFAGIGALITVFLPSHLLVAIFCVVLLFMGIKMIYRRFPLVFPLLIGPCRNESYGRPPAERSTLCIYPVHLVSWGSLAGFMSGLTGIGGGIVNVPALTIAGIPIHFAVATSAAVILITSLFATGTHLALGHVSVGIFIAIAIGAILGAQAGVRLSPRTPPRTLELAVGTLLILVVAALVISNSLP
ncbi:MAG: Sulfite exporter TauE/SafE [Methanoregulaceae archaeon PtaU1.Bin059]|nr:MAG: Sulfite exporter TauE/SafE [Methanoregulaceae archaeon PtaU1.Bin059]